MTDVNEHLDMAALEELQMIMEDDFALLLTTFLADGDIRVNEIKQALLAEDAEAVRRAAHSFKGSSSNVGAYKLSDLCFKMESAGKDNLLAGTADLFSDIEQCFLRTQELLTSYFLND